MRDESGDTNSMQPNRGFSIASGAKYQCSTGAFQFAAKRCFPGATTPPPPVSERQSTARFHRKRKTDFLIRKVDKYFTKLGVCGKVSEHEGQETNCSTASRASRPRFSSPPGDPRTRALNPLYSPSSGVLCPRCILQQWRRAQSKQAGDQLSEPNFRPFIHGIKRVKQKRGRHLTGHSLTEITKTWIMSPQM